MINYIVKDIVEVARNIDNTVVFTMSGDCSLGRGVAKQLDREFGLKNRLSDDFYNDVPVGEIVTLTNIIGLCDKESRYDIVDYYDIKICLEKLKQYAERNNLKSIYMPKIGCGCDDLEWDEVKKIIDDVFRDTDIIINVCVLSEDEIPSNDDTIELLRADLLVDNEENGVIVVNNGNLAEKSVGDIVSILFTDDYNPVAEHYIVQTIHGRMVQLENIAYLDVDGLDK